jgi:hypothetical protein
MTTNLSVFYAGRRVAPWSLATLHQQQARVKLHALFLAHQINYDEVTRGACEHRPTFHLRAAHGRGGPVTGAAVQPTALAPVCQQAGARHPRRAELRAHAPAA